VESVVALIDPIGKPDAGVFVCPERAVWPSSGLCLNLPHQALGLYNREIRALFAYFGAERAKILCNSNCMA